MNAPARTTVRHNRIDLVVHHLRPASDETCRPLLLLHGLGEETPREVPAHVSWPGEVIGLDFTGHGASTVPVGGGYTSEILVGDVDAVLQVFDQPVTVLGRGLGAYIALLVAAARSDVVHGAVLADGPGLAGGGVNPGSPALWRSLLTTGGSPDPAALVELARDVRPPDYARTFVGFVVEGSALDQPLFVATRSRPAWIEAVADEAGVGTGTVAEGLAFYATVPSPS